MLSGAQAELGRERKRLTRVYALLDELRAEGNYAISDRLRAALNDQPR